MIILREYKWLQKVLGLNPLGGLENIILQMVYLVPLFTCDVMFTIYFALNISENSYRAMTALPGCFAFTVLIAIYSHLLTRRERFYLLIDELQGIVNESTKFNRFFTYRNYKRWVNLFDFLAGVGKHENEKIYVEAEKLSNFSTKIIIYGTFWIPTLTLAPIVLAVHHWYLEKYTLDSWIILFPVW